jgi:hypothetical protein
VNNVKGSVDKGKRFGESAHEGKRLVDERADRAVRGVIGELGRLGEHFGPWIYH